MTMIAHTAVPAPARPQIRIKLGFLAKMAKILVQAHRNNREAQNMRHANDAILKDVGLTRLRANGKNVLYSHWD